MENLVGKSEEETRQKIRKYARDNGFTILEDRVIDSSLEVGKSRPTRYMTITNGKQTVSLSINRDGSVRRQVRSNPSRRKKLKTLFAKDRRVMPSWLLNDLSRQKEHIAAARRSIRKKKKYRAKGTDLFGQNPREAAELRALGKRLQSGHRVIGSSVHRNPSRRRPSEKGIYLSGPVSAWFERNVGYFSNKKAMLRMFAERFSTDLRRASQLYKEWKRQHGRIPEKNLFGFGAGESRDKVEKQRKREAHAALDRGDYRGARRITKMSTRKFAKKRGIKVEGRFRPHLRTAKARARQKAHGLIDKIFGNNPTQVKRNALPAILAAIEEGAGTALGAAAATTAFKDATRGKGKTVKRKSSHREASGHGKTKRNPRQAKKYSHETRQAMAHFLRSLPKRVRKWYDKERVMKRKTKRNPQTRRKAKRNIISFAQAVARIRKAGKERGAKAVKIRV